MRSSGKDKIRSKLDGSIIIAMKENVDAITTSNENPNHNINLSKFNNKNKSILRVMFRRYKAKSSVSAFCVLLICFFISQLIMEVISRK